MTTLESLHAWKRARSVVLTAFASTLLLAGMAQGQSPDRYVLGDSPHLEMMVHIIGEVQRPGEFRVPDNTNVLELFSKAGGPTPYSNLSNVTISRFPNPLLAAGRGAEVTTPPRSQVMHVNLKQALSAEQMVALPTLLPGDVVMVPRNSWHTWKNFAAVARDISVIASVYLIFVRTTR
jgi:hypothetical protein